MIWLICGSNCLGGMVVVIMVGYDQLNPLQAGSLFLGMISLKQIPRRTQLRSRCPMLL